MYEIKCMKSMIMQMTYSKKKNHEESQNQFPCPTRTIHVFASNDNGAPPKASQTVMSFFLTATSTMIVYPLGKVRFIFKGLFSKSEERNYGSVV